MHIQFTVFSTYTGFSGHNPTVNQGAFVDNVIPRHHRDKSMETNFPNYGRTIVDTRFGGCSNSLCLPKV